MQRTLKLIFCLLIVVSILAVIRFPFAFSQEEEESALVKELSGEVTSVDLKNSAIAIKQLKDKESLTYETTTIYVNDSTYTEKDYEAITLAELKVSDKVTVEYTTDETGNNIATTIWIESKE